MTRKVTAAELRPHERAAVTRGYDNNGMRRNVVDPWLNNGGPRPPMDDMGGAGSGGGGPWPTVSDRRMPAGIEVLRYTPAAERSWREWKEYWDEATGGDRTARWTDDMYAAAPAKPFSDGEWLLVPWPEVRLILLEHRDGTVQPALFEEAA